MFGSKREKQHKKIVQASGLTTEPDQLWTDDSSDGNSNRLFRGEYVPVSTIEMYLQRARKQMIGENFAATADASKQKAPLGMIVPHAALKYSGICAATAFAYAQKARPSVDTVWLLAASHRRLPQNLAFVRTQTARPLPDLGAASDVQWQQEALKDNADARQEHAYWMVDSFVRVVWPQAKQVYVLLVTDSSKAPTLARAIRESLSDPLRSVIVCSTDFTHYGAAAFGHVLAPVGKNSTAVHQLAALNADQNLFDALCSTTASIDKYLDTSNACGPHALRVLVNVMREDKQRGRLLCHYNSRQSDAIARLNFRDDALPFAFFETFDNNDSFVSYGAIIYDTPQNLAARIEFDDIALMSFVRNTVLWQYVGSEMAPLPKCSVWSDKTQGAFTGVRNRQRPYEVRASKGEFETQGAGTTAKHVRSSALTLSDDAENRWRQPLTQLELFDANALQFGITLLEPLSNWMQFATSALPDFFANDAANPSTVQGVRLFLATGESAVFLPSVWQERPDWSRDDLLTALAQKALGTKDTSGNEWKHKDAYVLLFRSESLYPIEIETPQ